MLLVGLSVASAGILVHPPAVDAMEGAPLSIRVQNTDSGDMAVVEVFYRTERRGEWRSLGFSRSVDGSWSASIPAEDVRGDWLEYYIASDGRDRFASAEEPHRIALGELGEIELVERELARFDGQRTRFAASYQRLNLGAPEGLTDGSWQGDFQVTYRPLGTVRSLHFGFARMRGTAVERSEGEFVQSLDSTDQETWGLDRGWAELELRAAEKFSVSPTLVLGANSSGFTAGAGAAMRIGLDPGTNLRAYGLFVGGGTGGEFGVALAWDTVPHVPMSAGIVVSNWPNDSLYGVRLRYDLEIPLGERADLLAGGSYQARTTTHGGLGFRGGFAWAF